MMMMMMMRCCRSNGFFAGMFAAAFCILGVYVFVESIQQLTLFSSLPSVATNRPIDTKSSIASGDAHADGRNAATEDDAYLRVRRIVDGLPEIPFDATQPKLKHGFYLLPSASGFFSRPITPETELRDAETTFHRSIESPQINCPDKTRIGRMEDGGWDACVTGPFNISSPCLVYSIGMGGEWSFDQMITDKYKCLDMAYDPTLGKPDHKPKELLWFYNTGLGRTNIVNDKKWKLRTFGRLLEENGHVDTSIDILKMDIEYSEWESLEAILLEKSLRRVKQLLVELHTAEVTEGQHTTSQDYSYYYQILRGLDRLGFKFWHYLPTPTGHYKSKHTGKDLPCCGNIYFVNVNYVV